MPQGRYVREFDIVYVEALRAAYPDATPEELAEMTYRSRMTVRRILDGDYDFLRGPESSQEARKGGGSTQLTLDFDSGLKTQINVLSEKLEHMEERLGWLEGQLSAGEAIA